MNAVNLPVYMYLPCFINGLFYLETNKINQDSEVYWQM